MSDTTEEQADETEAPEAEDERPFRVRDVFRFRRPAALETDEEPAAEEAAPEVPPMPTEPPTIPAARVGRAARTDDHHVPNWWDADKTQLTTSRPSADGVKWINGVPHHVPAPKPCTHPNPHEVRNKLTSELLAYWCADCETQLDVPDDYDELTDVTDEDGDGGEADEDGQAVDKVPPTIRQRWGQGLRGTGQKSYSRPVYGKDSAERKKALVEVWGQMSRKTRHLLYNGTALGAGFYIGVPQFFTAEVAYLVDTYSSWTDFYVCIWYGVAVGIWALDYRTHGWFPVFSWLARIPLVSMIVGALLYGTAA
ncbi:hypothetical protein OHA04_27480 [Streptomyces sp. NBC_01590]|uniref:hypothetical protein n=1 Tax=Streptomyces sp. NBC_01590 TaxID=2975887 RepID=UPI003867BB12